MIKLIKLRLINWHYFTNTTVDIENITFLTGANGTGKSTIIDALQTVLLGDTTRTKRNDITIFSLTDFSTEITV